MATNTTTKDYVCGAAQAALSIDMIVQCIFGYLKTNFEDVKTFRLISPTCNKMLNSHFSATSKISNHQLSERAKTSGISAAFDSLKHTFASSQQFPCNAVEVGGLWKLENPGVKSFLESYGQNISQLILSRTVVPLEVQYFGELLLHWLPSLRILNVNSWNFEKKCFRSGTTFLARPRTLENLRVLTFDLTNPQIRNMSEMELIVFQDIILASPNLESLEICEAFLNVAYVGRKAHLIKSLKVHSSSIISEDNNHNTNFFQTFEEQSPKVKQLELHVSSCDDSANYHRLKMEMISWILSQSSESLETLTITCSNPGVGISFMLKLRLPVFRNLTTMNLADLYLLNCTISHGSNISDFLPALRNVDVNARNLFRIDGRRGYELGENLFNFGQVMSSVKRLEIHTRYITAPLMKEMAETFPEVESVGMHWWGECRDEILWLLPKKVKEIQVRNFPLRFYQNLKLESLITGIPQEVCQSLKETSRNLVRFEGLVEFPSIRTLENLVELKFFCADFPIKDPRDGFGYFSNLTKWLILEPMAELQLKLAFPQVISRGCDAIYPTLGELPEFAPIADHLIVTYFGDK